MQRRAFLTSLAALAVPAVVRADCIPMDLAARYVTRPGAVIPADGGVLVALTAVDRPAPSGDSFAGPWTLVAGARRTPLRATDVGPGLRRLELPARARGALVVEGPIGTLEVTRGEAVALLEQPAVRLVFAHAPAPGETPRVSVNLVRPVPQGAVAGVLRRHVGARPVPTLRGRAQAGTLFVSLNDLPRCTPMLPGSLVPSVGTEVDLVYLDAFGRASAASGRVRLTN